MEFSEMSRDPLAGVSPDRIYGLARKGQLEEAFTASQKLTDAPSQFGTLLNLASLAYEKVHSRKKSSFDQRFVTKILDEAESVLHSDALWSNSEFSEHIMNLKLLAMQRLRLDDTAGGIKTLAQIRTLSDSIPDHSEKAYVLNSLSLLYDDAGQKQEARNVFELARKAAGEIEDAKERAEVLSNIS